MPVPNWNDLFEIAAGQGGLFTTQQAASAGYSPQLIAHHTRAGRIAAERRGIHRLVHFPPTDDRELVAAWLWTDRAGVFSHHTALALHELSDILPSRLHVTLPAAWRTRRLRIPDRVVVHHADVAPADREWIGAVPVTSPARTLLDCAAGHLAPDLMAQALDQVRARGLAPRELVDQIGRSIRAR
jgi:predicted transcriptional regulator of viral defense system